VKSPPIIGILLLLAAPMAAQVTAVAPSSDNLAVRSVVGAYLYGLKHNTVDSLKAAFLPEARLYFVKRDGTLGQLTQEEWYRGFAASAGKEEEGDLRIASLEITKDIATVKVVERYPKSTYTDYLNLVRSGGAWRIVNKVFTAEAARGGEPT
jgi:hypothetical protein